MKIKDTFITITGLNHYLGTNPFKVGRLLKLLKDTDNEYDADAIRVEMPYLDTVGYVANSTYSVYGGTCSASRVYEKIDAVAYAQVMFITHSSVIARILTKEEAIEIFRSHDDFFGDMKHKGKEGLSSDYVEDCGGIPYEVEDKVSF